MFSTLGLYVCRYHYNVEIPPLTLGQMRRHEA
jgi:hypothetical protein